MRVTDRKYLDLYIKSIGKEIPALIENYDNCIEFLEMLPNCLK